MRACSFISFLFLLSLSLGHAQEMRLKVQDARLKTPLSDCYVYYGGQVQISDHQGEFLLPISDDSTALICVNRYGYRDTCVSYGELRLKGKIEMILRSELLLQAEVRGYQNRLSQELLRETVLRVEVQARDLGKIPVVLGERDLMKNLQLSAGVQSGTPGSANLLVRGMGHYQNQVLIDDIPIYNVDHFNGMTSPFPSQGVESATLYMQNLPIEHNGGSSALVSVKSTSGNSQKRSGGIELGIGSLSANINVPISRNKANAFLAMRSSNSGLTAGIANRFFEGNLPAIGFEDLMAGVNYQLSEKHHLKFTQYLARNYTTVDLNQSGAGINADQEQVGLNTALGLQLNSRVSENIYFRQIAYLSHYKLRHDYSAVQGSGASQEDFQLNYESGISSAGFKSMAVVNKAKGRLLNFGFYFDSKRIRNPTWSTSLTVRNQQKDSSLLGAVNTLNEIGLYYGEKIKLSNKLNLDIGARLQIHSILDGRFVLMPNIRGTLLFEQNSKFSYFLSYDEFSQDFHRIRQAQMLSYQDFAVGASASLPIQKTQQLSLGGVFAIPWISLSAQAYYRKINNDIDRVYQGTSFFTSVRGSDGSSLLSFPENQMVSVDGMAYGLDLTMILKFKRLKLDVFYGLSNSERNSSLFNQGTSYPYLLNRNQNLNLLGTIKLKKNSIGKVMLLSARFFYGSGQYAQFPLQFIPSPDLPYQNSGRVLPLIESRHSTQLPPLHHLDFLFSTISENDSRIRTFSISLFNVYFSEVINTLYWDRNTLKGEGFLPFVPSISYNYQWK